MKYNYSQFVCSIGRRGDQVQGRDGPDVSGAGGPQEEDGGAGEVQGGARLRPNQVEERDCGDQAVVLGTEARGLGREEEDGRHEAGGHGPRAQSPGTFNQSSIFFPLTWTIRIGWVGIGLMNKMKQNESR